jgi:outer membrane protein
MTGRYGLNTGRKFLPLLVVSAILVLLIFLDAEKLFALDNVASEPEYKDNTSKTSLSLSQAIDIALRKNRGIASSAYNAESTRYSIDAARAEFDLQLIPTGEATLEGGTVTDSDYVSVGMQFQKKLEYGTVVSIGPQVTRTYDSSSHYNTTDMGVTVIQPLLRGAGKETATGNLQTAEAAYKTSLRNVYQTRVNTVLGTVSSYYEAVRQLEMLKLYEKMSERLKGHSAIARSKEKVGLSTPMDTYRAEIPLKETEDSIISASEAYQSAKNKLKLILALPQTTELELIVPETFNDFNLSLDDAIDTALKNRIELEQMNQDMAEAERNAEIAKQNILPDLNLVVKYGRYASSNAVNLPANLNHNRYSLSLQVGSDISRTAEKAAYRQSLLNIKTLNVSLESKKEDISWEVRKQWLSLRESTKRIEIRKYQIKQGEEKLALAEVKFAHGMADNFDIIEAEKELQSARGNLLSAEIECAIGNYNLKAILGTLVLRN